MIDNNTSFQKPLNINTTGSVQTDRECASKTASRSNFEPVRSKNPGHDGCNVTKEQVEAKAAEPAKTQPSGQSAGTEKVSGNCPGGNLIAQILQDLLAALQDVKIGR